MEAIAVTIYATTARASIAGRLSRAALDRIQVGLDPEIIR